MNYVFVKEITKAKMKKVGVTVLDVRPVTEYLVPLYIHFINPLLKLLN